MREVQWLSFNPLHATIRKAPARVLGAWAGWVRAGIHLGLKILVLLQQLISLHVEA